MVYSIRTDFLSDEDAARVYAENPRIKADPREYCPTCMTRGTYRWRGKEHQCDCALQLQLQKHYLNSGIALTYQVLDWDDFIVDNTSKEAALATVKAYLAD